MAKLSIDQGVLTIDLSPWDKFLAVHGSLHIPLQHVRAVRIADQGAWAHVWTKVIGTSIPGVKKAGTFFSGDGLVFCDYSTGDSCLEIELANETYRKIIVQLDADENPAAVAAEISAAITPIAPQAP
ncbi:MAG: hypothetical protein M3Y21_08345 [Candidatus Eremiobacteraeota bacterium]|nr:hypothetical protein [Candidatus Eremiobacteraeota bacterium]